MSIYDGAFLGIYFNDLLFSQLKLHHRCPTGLYKDLRKYWNFQCEAKAEQTITIVTTRSVSFFSFDFSIILFSEIWFNDSILNSQSLYELPNYKSIHQVRNYGKGGGVSIYIKNSINWCIIAFNWIFMWQREKLMFCTDHQRDWQNRWKSF